MLKRRRLPHLDVIGQPLFVTIRLHDILPGHVTECLASRPEEYAWSSAGRPGRPPQAEGLPHFGNSGKQPTKYTLVCLFLVVLLASGCSMRSGRKPALPAAQPVAAKPAPATSEPEPPLSVPQTMARLPEPQPISEEALATLSHAPRAKEASEEIETLPEPRPARPRRANGSGAGTGAAPPAEPAVPPASTAAETPSPRIRPVGPAEESQRVERQLGMRRSEVESLLAQLTQPEIRTETARVRSFLELADQAMARGDFAQADILSTRALTLARELTRAR